MKRLFSLFVYSLMLALSGWLAAVSANELPLPDKITLKPGTPPPRGVAGPEIKGAVVEETASELRLETSTFRGISNILVFPLSSIESVERGDHSERDYLILLPFLQLPEVSPHHDLYEKELLPLFNAFLARHSSGKRADEVSAVRRRVESEMELMRQGRVRLGTFWMSRVDLPPEYKNDWILWQELNKDPVLSGISEFEALVAKVMAAQNRVFYPFFVEKLLNVSRKRVQTLVEALGDPDLASSDKKVLAETKIFNEIRAVETKPLKQAVELLGQIQETSVDADFDQAVLRTQILECKSIWPGLETLDLVLEQALRHHIRQADTFLADKKLMESVSALAKAGEVLPLIQNPQAKKEYEEASQRQSVNKLLEEARQLLSEGEEGSALTRLASVLQSLPPESPLSKSVEELSDQASRQLNDKAIQECARLRDAGEFEQALDLIRLTQTQLLDFKSLKIEQADRLALEAVSLAQDSAFRLQLLTAIKASYTGWSISPTNTKARISCLVVVVGLLVSGLVFFLLLVIAYSFVANLLHKQRFDMRLESLREDQRARRIATARKRKNTGQK